MKELNTQEVAMVAGGKMAFAGGGNGGGLIGSRIRAGAIGNYGGWSALAGGVVGGILGGPIGAVVGAALGASMGRY